MPGLAVNSGPWGSDLLMTVGPDGTMDLDAGGAEVVGAEVVVQRVLRRLTMVRGAAVAHPNDGIDVRSWVRSGVLAATAGWMQSAIQQELAKESAIRAVGVAVTWTAATSTLVLAITFTIATKPLALTLALTPSTVSVIVDGAAPAWATGAA